MSDTGYSPYPPNLKGGFIEAMGMMGFIFGIVGLVAFGRVTYLIKKLKAKGILDLDNKEE